MDDLKTCEALVLEQLSSTLSTSTGPLKKLLTHSPSVASVNIEQLVEQLQADGFVNVIPNPITDEKHISPTVRGLEWYRSEGVRLVQSSKASYVPDFAAGAGK